MSNFRVLTMASLVAVMYLAAGVSAVSAQDEPAGELLDVVMMQPEQMVIEQLLVTSGLIVLDGNEYQLDPKFLGTAKRANAPGVPLEIDDLEAGMTVWVVTDGLEPMRGQRPAILGLWGGR